jgi:uncharacterized protein (TIGR02996 family)
MDTDAEETSFLRAIRFGDDPNVTRLIYADWLEERGDFRAEYLRLRAELITLWAKVRAEGDARRSPDVETIARKQIRTREVLKDIGTVWLALMHRGKVTKCDFQSRKVPECPSRWESLADTDKPLVRHCEVCNKDVRYCETPREYEAWKRGLLVDRDSLWLRTDE